MLRQNGGSSTCVVEPVELQDVSNLVPRPEDAKVTGSAPSLQIHETLGSQRPVSENIDPVENLPSPTTAPAEKKERRNAPRKNLFRTLAAFWSFIVMGSNDAAYGVCSLNYGPSVKKSRANTT
jgi:hypothetical protein